MNLKRVRRVTDLNSFIQHKLGLMDDLISTCANVGPSSTFQQDGEQGERIAAMQRVFQMTYKIYFLSFIVSELKHYTIRLAFIFVYDCADVYSSKCTHTSRWVRGYTHKNQITKKKKN